MESVTPARAKKMQRADRRERRRQIAASRDRDADDTALAAAITDLLDAEGVGPGDTVSLYEALPVEPPTAATTAALTARGLRVIVPITLPDLDLDWAYVADPARTPLGHNAIGDAALVLTPGLSVDCEGTRLGQGGGCYDRALPRRAPGVKVVVMLHPGEFAADLLPRAAHDEVVDGVVTADGLTWCRRGD